MATNVETGYVCGTDFDEEIGGTFVKIHPMLHNPPCKSECGIYKVEMKPIKRISKQEQVLYGWKSDAELLTSLREEQNKRPVRVAYASPDQLFELYGEQHSLDENGKGGDMLVLVTLIEVIQDGDISIYKKNK